MEGENAMWRRRQAWSDAATGQRMLEAARSSVCEWAHCSVVSDSLQLHEL